MPRSLPGKLTELTVARIKPPPKGYVWKPDRLLPSFGIRIYATGRRVWGITRRWNGAAHPSFKRIGEHPALSLADARDRARQMIARGAPAAPVKFKELVEEFLQHGRTKKGRPLRQNSVVQYRRNLNRYAKPLHERDLAEVTRRDVAELLRQIARTSGATTASLVRSMLRRLWAYGIEVDAVDYNVVEHAPSYAVAKRQRVLTDGELAAIWAATKDGEPYSMIIRLLLWTGARRSEVGGMRLSELVDGEWRLPGSRTKNGRDLILPLPHQARAAIASLPRVVGKDTLFGRTSSSGFNGWSAAKLSLDAQLGFDRDWDVHDIRRTVQTRLIGLGVNRDVVNRTLNHAMGPIDEAYDLHTYTTEKQAALQQWADKLDQIVTEKIPEIVPMRCP